MVNLPTYTGERAGAGQINPIGDKTLQAQERMNETILEANKFKYTERKKEEAEFLKGIEVTPEVLLSAKMREQQATKIQEFNKIWSPAIKKGYLTMEEKTRMATDRAILEGWQKDQLGKLGMWKQMNDAVTANPLELDSVEMQEITRKLFEEGELTVTRPPVRAKNVANYLKQYSSKITDEFPSEPILENRGGTTFRRTQTTNIKSDQIQQKIEEALLSGNEGVLKGLVEDFDRYNPTESDKAKWLVDIDQSGSIDTEERQNGILKWAKQHPPYQQMAITKSSDWMPVSKPSGTGTASNSVTLGGTPVKINPGYQRAGDVPYGSTIYTRPYSFGSSTALVNVPVSGGRKHRGTITSKLISDKGSIRAQLLEYDPDKDVLIVRSVASNNALGLDSQDVIEIPASNLQGVDDIPILIDGRKGTIGELRANKATPQTTTIKKIETDVSSLFIKK